MPQIIRINLPAIGKVKEIGHLGINCLCCGKEKATKVIEIVDWLYPGEPQKGEYSIFPHLCEECGKLSPGGLIKKLVEGGRR